MATYREDMRRAWERINSFPTQRLETRFGTIEYADRGEGVPLLVCSGTDAEAGVGWGDLPSSLVAADDEANSRAAQPHLLEIMRAQGLLRCGCAGLPSSIRPWRFIHEYGSFPA